METVTDAAGEVKELVQDVQEGLPKLTEYIIKILLVVIAFWIGSKIIHWVGRKFRKYLRKLKVAEGVVTFGCSVVQGTLYVGLVLILAQRLGVKETSIAAVVGTAGVTIGLALQGGLSNVAGGLIILAFKPFQVGDYIVCKSQGFEGQVIKIELFYTTLESKGFQRTHVPNSILTGNTLVNETVHHMRQVEVKVGVAYPTDLDKARQVLMETALLDPDVNREYEPLIFVDELGESGIVMALRVRTGNDVAALVKWRLNQKIKENFEKAGIEIPYPQVQVHLPGKVEKD